MIQWYPGHMAKAIREMNEALKLVDLVMVILDARVPFSSLNPEIKKMVANKRTLYILNKQDKADNKMTPYWIDYYTKKESLAISIDARSNKAKKQVESAALLVMKEKIEKDKAKGLKFRPIRTMIVGIPNVGKSTLINTLCNKKVASTGDKPGVTKSQQWTRINDKLELLDTPGVLWPKFEDQTVAKNLAISGAIKDDIIRSTDIGIYLIDFLHKYYPSAIMARYDLDYTEDALNTLKLIGKKLGFLLDNKEVDIDKTSIYLLQEYRNEYFGRITLDQNADETL